MRFRLDDIDNWGHNKKTNESKHDSRGWSLCVERVVDEEVVNLVVVVSNFLDRVRAVPIRRQAEVCVVARYF